MLLTLAPWQKQSEAVSTIEKECLSYIKTLCSKILPLYHHSTTHCLLQAGQAQGPAIIQTETALTERSQVQP